MNSVLLKVKLPEGNIAVFDVQPQHVSSSEFIRNYGKHLATKFGDHWVPNKSISHLKASEFDAVGWARDAPHFVSISASEGDAGLPAFWSNDLGWVIGLENASQFSEAELEDDDLKSCIPFSSGHDATWVCIDKLAAKSAEISAASDQTHSVSTSCRPKP